MTDMKDTLALRKAFGSAVSSVFLVTTLDANSNRRAMTISSFTSLSLTPPLCMYALEDRARRYNILTAAKEYAICVLAAKQNDMAIAFSKGDGEEVWNQFACEKSDMLGMPIPKGIKSYFECKAYRSYEGGDHTIVIGEVVSYAVNGSLVPMSYYNGQFDLLHL